jgi:hypothetical protein
MTQINSDQVKAAINRTHSYLEKDGWGGHRNTVAEWRREIYERPGQFSYMSIAALDILHDLGLDDEVVVNS